jgi:hypothetical protein
VDSIESGGARREQTGRGGLAVLLARGSATLEHGWLGSGSSYFLLAAARCLACPARQPAPAQALPKSLRQRRVLARQSVGLRGHSQRGGRALGRSSGANGARVPPAQRMASLGPTSASPPVSCKKPSFFIGANRPCARLAPARLHASRRARACLQPAAVSSAILQRVIWRVCAPAAQPYVPVRFPSAR